MVVDVYYSWARNQKRKHHCADEGQRNDPVNQKRKRRGEEETERENDPYEARNSEDKGRGESIDECSVW